MLRISFSLYRKGWLGDETSLFLCVRESLHLANNELSLQQSDNGENNHYRYEAIHMLGQYRQDRNARSVVVKINRNYTLYFADHYQTLLH